MFTGVYLHMWEGEDPAYKDPTFDFSSALPEGSATLQIYYTAGQIHYTALQIHYSRSLIHYTGLQIRYTALQMHYTTL